MESGFISISEMSKENSNDKDEKGPSIITKTQRNLFNSKHDLSELPHEKNMVISAKGYNAINDSTEKLNNTNCNHIPTPLNVKKDLLLKNSKTNLELDINLECDENMDFDSQDEEESGKKMEIKHNKLDKNTCVFDQNFVVNSQTPKPRRQRKQILQTRFEDKDELMFTTETSQKLKNLLEKKKLKSRKKSLSVSSSEKTSSDKLKRKCKLIKSSAVEQPSVKTNMEDENSDILNGGEVDSNNIKVELNVDNEVNGKLNIGIDVEEAKIYDENEEKESFKRRMGRPKGSKDKIKRKRRGKMADANEFAINRKMEADNSDDDLICLKVHSLNIRKLGGNKVNRGPVIRITGSKERPKSCSVINIPSTEIGTLKFKSRKSSLASLSVKPPSSPMITSTICTQSVSWNCSLCSKPSYYGVLGELYGPYYPPGHKVSDYNTNLHASTKTENKKTDLRYNDGNNSFKGKFAKDANLKMGIKKNERKRKHSMSNGESNELWVHAACAVWADGVFIVGSGVYGLQQAVKSARQVVCVYCKNTGATIGCLTKGCHEVFHFICAIEKGCILLEENFTMLCSIHKNKPVKMKD